MLQSFSNLRKILFGFNYREPNITQQFTTLLQEVLQLECDPLHDIIINIAFGQISKSFKAHAFILSNSSQDLAKQIGAATACSKPVADVGWRPHGEHVGQTGIVISADLYIAANNEIKKLYGEKFWISHLSFRKFLQKDCYLQESNSKSSNIAGIIRFTNNQELKELKIFEGKKIPQRSNDDLDSEIRKFCKIIRELKSAQTIIQKKISTIHSIVATTKFLHQEIVKKTGKWILETGFL